MPEREFADDFVEEEFPDALEKLELSRTFSMRFRNVGYRRLADFEGKSDIDLLRGPNVSRPMIKALRAAEARYFSSPESRSGHSQ